MRSEKQAASGAGAPPASGQVPLRLTLRQAVIAVGFDGWIGNGDDPLPVRVAFDRDAALVRALRMRERLDTHSPERRTGVEAAKNV